MKKVFSLIIIFFVCFIFVSCNSLNEATNIENSLENEQPLSHIHEFDNNTVCISCGFVLKEAEGLVYSRNSNEELVVKSIGNCSENYILIPKQHNGESVTEISDKAFQNCANVVFVKIQNNIKNIGNNAFNNCYNLKEVVFEEGLENVGDKAFFGCSNLLNVQLPNTIYNIGNSAFQNCINLKSFFLTSSIKDMGVEVFSNCNNLKNCYFYGEKSQWDKLEFMCCAKSDFTYDKITDAICYYSENEPTDKKVRYWHYVNNVITIWE